jgi:hypothetical protein
MDPNAQTLPGQMAAGELTAKSGDLLAKAEQIKTLIADLKSANADLEAKLASVMARSPVSQQPRLTWRQNYKPAVRSRTG